MQPSNGQLLKLLRKATGQLQQQVQAPESQALLGGIDVVINELLLRENRAFFIDHYRSGRQLLAEGMALLPAGAAALGKAADNLPAALDSELAAQAIGDRSLALTAAVEQLVNALGNPADAAAQALLARISAWELALFAYRLQRAPATSDNKASSTPNSLTINKDSVLQYLRQKQPGWKNLEITHYHQVAGGFSKLTILVDTQDDVNGKQSLAFRAEQPIHLLALDGSDIANEFPLVQKAFASGIAVAEPLWIETGSNPLNTRFIVSRKASGANFGDARSGSGKLSAAVVKDLARVMAATHNISMKRGDAWIENSHFGKWLDWGATNKQNTLARIEEWRRQMRNHDLYPSPLVARAMNWLAANVPEQNEPPVFLHGDFGPHNILLDGDRVSAVLDWEISTPGDPAYDVCWFLNCAGTAVDRQEFLDAYREAGGKPVTEYQLRYFDVFPCMFMPITCNAALKLIEENADTNINLAFYGLQFMHEYPSRLEAAIARAEAVRDSR